MGTDTYLIKNKLYTNSRKSKQLAFLHYSLYLILVCHKFYYMKQTNTQYGINKSKGDLND